MSHQTRHSSACGHCGGSQFALRITARPRQFNSESNDREEIRCRVYPVCCPLYAAQLKLKTSATTTFSFFSFFSFSLLFSLSHFLRVFQKQYPNSYHSYAVCCMLHAVCCILYAVCCILHAIFDGAVRDAHFEGVRGDVCGMLSCMLYAVYCMLFLMGQ